MTNHSIKNALAEKEAAFGRILEDGDKLTIKTEG